MVSSPCKECRNFLSQWYDRRYWDFQPGGGPPHHSITTLQTSAAAGCEVCSLFLDSLSPAIISELSVSSPDKTSIVQIDKRNGVAVTVRLRFSGFGIEGISAVIEIGLPRPYTRKDAGPAEKIATSTDSKETWELLEQWKNTCLTTHEQCRAPLIEHSLPTRLVSVGSSDEDVRLCLSATLPPATKYLTLSHCWGKLQFTMLKTENLDSMLDNIKIADLTKTFQDAVHITRKLKFRYIWIDSLCIIQNSVKDWEIESSSMTNVYANSELNICASSAVNGAIGCFFERPPFKVRGCRVKVTQYKDRPDEIWDCYPENLLLKAIERNIATQRAWVFQETRLAPRTVHFGSEQLAWQCRELQVLEMFPEAFGDGSVGGVVWREQSLARMDNKRLMLENVWWRLVMDYSSTNITYVKDRLVALAGITQLIASRHKWTYLAGLWNVELRSQLLWMVLYPGPRPEEYVAPTWSWASVNVDHQKGGVLGGGDTPPYYPIPPENPASDIINLQYHCEIKDVSVTLLNKAYPYGQVSGGHIRISSENMLYVTIENRVSSNGTTNTLPYFIALFDGNDISMTPEAIVWHDEDSMHVGMQLFILPICSHDKTPSVWLKESDVRCVRGLVLKLKNPDPARPELEALGTTIFERVGNCEINGSHLTKYYEACDANVASLRSHNFDHLLNRSGEGFEIIIV